MLVSCLLLMVSVLFLNATMLSGQSYWMKTYGGVKDDDCWSIAVAPDGKVIVAGSTLSFTVSGKPLSSGLIFAVDRDGNIMWQKAYGGSSSDHFVDVAVTPDGGLVVLGCTLSFKLWKYADFWLLKLDSSGNIVWEKVIGGDKFEQARKVAVASDGSIIIAGETESFGSKKNDIWVLKLSSKGDVVWQRVIGGAGYDYVRGLAVAPDGSIVLSITSFSFKGDLSEAWIVKLNSEGNVMWQKVYRGEKKFGGSTCNGVTVLSDGSIIVVGSTTYFKTKFGDAFVMKLDPDGNVKWFKTYGWKSHDCFRSVALAPSGNIIVVGDTDYMGSPDIWVAKLNSEGSVLWSSIFGGSLYEYVGEVSVLPTGEIVVGASTKSFGAGETDVMLILLPESGVPQGSVNCSAKTVPLSKVHVVETSLEARSVSGKIGSSKAGVIEISLVAKTQQEFVFGFLEVSSVPAGASVYVDESFIGVTPLRITVSVGTHKIKVVKAGYKPYETTVEVRAGETAKLSVKLEVKKAELTITSNPSGAEVYIDDKRVGTTPLKLKLAPGTYTIKIVKEGYREYIATIKVSAGETKSISTQLKKKPSEVGGGLLGNLTIIAVVAVIAIIVVAVVVFTLKKRRLPPPPPPPPPR